MTATAAQNVSAIARKIQSERDAASSETPPGLTLQQRETAQYIADMILELRNMAKAAKLFHVMVPLEYAYYEAFSIANQVIAPPEELLRLRQLEAAAAEADSAVTEDY